MNLLYITYLLGRKWTGPNYSVPSQIQAQSEYDNVFWYNINDLFKEEKTKDLKCHDINDFPKLKISELPEPFNTPNLVIFEGVYFYPFCKIARECKRRNIPYIIIPRSSLTQFAQSSKKIKKKIGNLLLFNSFIKNATAIQYLTENEHNDSGDKWNRTNIIIPNGIEPKKNIKQFESKDGLKGSFIGRLDIYQKGIDILLEACMSIKEDMLNYDCKIDIYGPERNNWINEIQKMIDDKGLNNLIILKGPVFDREKEKVLLNSDFFVLTSRFEGHPIGLIEALSYGLPCIVTTGSNMSEEINTFNAGWTAEISAESIALSLRSLFKDKKHLGEKGNNALELSKNYDWNRLAKVSHNKYHEIIIQRDVKV